MRAVRSLLVHFDWIHRDEYVFSADKINKLLQILSDSRTDTLHLFLKIKPERVHTMFCGLLILEGIISKYSIQTIQICTNGVREGYLIQKYIGD